MSQNIVETGTFYGIGSTRCFYAGMTHASQRLYSIDYNEAPLEYARSLYKGDSRVSFLLGTLTLPHEFSPLILPDASAEFYGPERDANVNANYVLSDVPDPIDLLLIDGGGWTASVEFDKLLSRTSIVALDDTNRERATKNWRNRARCMDLGFELIAERLDERNGWSIFNARHNEYDRIYRGGGWDGKGSGPGSTPAFTEQFRVMLPRLLSNEGIKTVLDYGCGDWSWQRFMDWNGVRYQGWDVSYAAIEAASKFPTHNCVKFLGDPFTRHFVPSDLLIVKDVMHHATLEQRERIVEKSLLFPKVLWVLDMDKDQRPCFWPRATLPKWQKVFEFDTSVENYGYGPKWAFLQRNL